MQLGCRSYEKNSDTVASLMKEVKDMSALYETTVTEEEASLCTACCCTCCRSLCAPIGRINPALRHRSRGWFLSQANRLILGSGLLPSPGYLSLCLLRSSQHSFWLRAGCLPGEAGCGDDRQARRQAALVGQC